jgi:hypothetical protein
MSRARFKSIAKTNTFTSRAAATNPASTGRPLRPTLPAHGLLGSRPNGTGSSTPERRGWQARLTIAQLYHRYDPLPLGCLDRRYGRPQR